LMVLGPDAAMTFTREHGIRALLLVRTADGRFEERESPGFSGRLPAGADSPRAERRGT
jgi:hypothetical protein